MSTSDSVDRVFVHALATVRRLPRTGSSRPPPSARLRLYGLYKQSMEGDVEAILPRPTLPPPSPTDLANAHTQPSPQNEGQPPPLAHRHSNPNGHPVQRYASRDLRTREAQAEIEKWDAWHSCAGMSRTEAKRKYISTLIDTMKEYASGTAESRELVGELEFVWGQIHSQHNSDSQGSREGRGSGSGRGGPGRREGEEVADDDSPRRSGMVPVPLQQMHMHSFAGLPTPPQTRDRQSRAPGTGPGPGGGDDPNRMRVLSPVSPRDSDTKSIVEGEEDLREGDERPHPRRRRATTPDAARALSAGQWRAGIDRQIRRLTLEITALREQLSANHLLASSTYGGGAHPHAQLSLRWKIVYKVASWLKWAVWSALRQAMVSGAVLAALIAWGRWRGDRGDRRVEEWARRRWKEVQRVLRRWWEEGRWWVGLVRLRVSSG